MHRWQSDDGAKFTDFDAHLSFSLESALSNGDRQFHVPEKNWLFDLVAMKQTNIQVAQLPPPPLSTLSTDIPCKINVAFIRRLYQLELSSESNPALLQLRPQCPASPPARTTQRPTLSFRTLRYCIPPLLSHSPMICCRTAGSSFLSPTVVLISSTLPSTCRNGIGLQSTHPTTLRLCLRIGLLSSTPRQVLRIMSILSRGILLGIIQLPASPQPPFLLNTSLQPPPPPGYVKLTRRAAIHTGRTQPLGNLLGTHPLLFPCTRRLLLPAPRNKRLLLQLLQRLLHLFLLRRSRPTSIQTNQIPQMPISSHLRTLMPCGSGKSTTVARSTTSTPAYRPSWKMLYLASRETLK